MTTAVKKYTIDDKKTIVYFEQRDSPIIPSLLPHQQDTVNRAPKKRLLAFSTGTGKTITAISLCNKHEVKNLLVIVPKKNVEQWAVEIQKFLAFGARCTIISKEKFKDMYKDKTLETPEAVIVDEGHYFAGINSTLSKSLWNFLRKGEIPIVYIATATPYCSTPFNIYTLAKHLGYNWNYVDFKNKFYYYINMGPKPIPKLKDGIEDEIAKYVKIIGDVVDMEEIVEVPKQEFIVENIPLTDEQKTAMSETFDPVAIVRWTKQHQVENGFLYETTEDEERIAKSFPSHKTTRILELCKAHDKMVIVSRYTHQIDLLRSLLEKEGIKTYSLTGKTKNSHEVVQMANTSDKCVFLMQASCSAGFELPTFRTMVFASLSFSHVDHEQALGRILRINHLHENTYIYLVADGMDRDVYDCIMKKKDFSIAIYKKEN